MRVYRSSEFLNVVMLPSSSRGHNIFPFFDTNFHFLCDLDETLAVCSSQIQLRYAGIKPTLFTLYRRAFAVFFLANTVMVMYRFGFGKGATVDACIESIYVFLLLPSTG